MIFNATGKVSRMQKQLEDAKTTWSMHEKLLESEQCLLEKMIYKMSSQFRSEKSLRSMNQVRAGEFSAFSPFQVP